MRYLIALLVFFISVEVSSALTPLLDSSPGFFSGEWAGSGAHGAYCYLNLDTEGRGLVLIDGGSGDWLGARIHWRNRQQSVEIKKIIPLPFSSKQRIIPLEQFTLSTGFNKSLKLNWNNHSIECNLQKTETVANHLARARSVIKNLHPSKSAQ